jgi:DNA-binding LacI/PurR family transcriptional regulator
VESKPFSVSLKEDYATVTPKYVAIRSHLQSLLQSDAFSHGDLFFTEKQICEKFEVSMATAKRVLNSLKELGVVERRRRAGTFVLKRSHEDITTKAQTVGVLLYDASNAFVPGFVRILQGIGEVLQERQYHLKVLISSTGSIEQVVGEASVDGLVVGYQQIQEDELAGLARRYSALVAFNRGLNLPGVHTISCDHMLEMLLAGELLSSLGHRCLAFFHGPAGFEITQEYLRGFHLIVNRFGFDSDPSLVVESDKGTRESTDAGLIPSAEDIASVRRMLESANRPTAFIMPTARLAEEVICHAEKIGLTVPKDLSVISLGGGLDEEDTTEANPRITCFRLDNKEGGRMAAKLLLDVLNGSSTVRKNTFFKSTLVLGQSTGPARVLGS